MTFFTFMDRFVIPAAIAIMLAGGISGLVLGCALVVNHDATLRFVTRMNRWVSTREAFAPLEASINVDPAVGPGGRRPLLGTFLVVGGMIAVTLLLMRLDFRHSQYAPGMDVKRWMGSSVALETMKWVLVAGSVFAVAMGALMLFAPQRMLSLERWLNQWHSTEPLAVASDRMHTPIEPRVEAYPRASGWIIAVASLALTLATIGLLIARHH